MGHLGVRAPYATRRKLRYEANQVWMNTTFISQGPQSSGKLAVEHMRQKYWRIQHAKIDTENIHKYLQQNQAKLIAKNRQNLLRKIKLGRTYCKIIKYWRWPKIFAYTKNIGFQSKYMRTSQNICAYTKY
jgi:hypothetical protein